MKWNEVPDGTSLAMSKQSAMEMRGGGPKTFFKGAICGAVLVIGLQSCTGSDDSTKPDTKPTPRPSATTTHKPN